MSEGRAEQPSGGGSGGGGGGDAVGVSTGVTTGPDGAVYTAAERAAADHIIVAAARRVGSRIAPELAAALGTMPDELKAALPAIGAGEASSQILCRFNTAAQPLSGVPHSLRGRCTLRGSSP